MRVSSCAAYYCKRICVQRRNTLSSLYCYMFCCLRSQFRLGWCIIYQILDYMHWHFRNHSANTKLMNCYCYAAFFCYKITTDIGLVTYCCHEFEWLAIISHLFIGTVKLIATQIFFHTISFVIHDTGWAIWELWYNAHYIIIKELYLINIMWLVIRDVCMTQMADETYDFLREVWGLIFHATQSFCLIFQG